MIFPRAERVKYGKTPLAEVVIQFSFKKRLEEADGFSTESLSNFHQQIMNEYPFFVPQNQQMFSLQLEQQSFHQDIKTVYHFTSADSKRKILVSNEWIALTTTAYDSWEQFKLEFEQVYAAFSSLYGQINKFNRVGLRYRDVIDRRKIDPNIASVNWTELLNEGIAPSVLFNDGIDENLNSYQTSFIVNLERDGKLVASLGLITNALTNEQAFLIDGDFFTEGELDYAGSIDAINYFNVEARNFFKWCIKPRLHECLQPTPYTNVGDA